MATGAGTAAMFLVGGGILVHGVPAAHDAVKVIGAAVATWPAGGLWAVFVSNLFNVLIGIMAGGVLLLGLTFFNRLRRAPVNID